MRYISVILLLSLSSIQAFGQTKESKAAPKEDGFEMKQYYFVMLTKGERRGEITDTAVINEIQRGHMANINRLAEMGKIVVAGPFGDNSNWRGIF
ncbi:MAG: hypothetical protein K8F30_07910, partial [Taibaiella sp.]|nr:hypothetical protein [Taibaiella sp.]